MQLCCSGPVSVVEYWEEVAICALTVCFASESYLRRTPEIKQFKSTFVTKRLSKPI